jgi:phenylacetate-CoA ligase
MIANPVPAAPRPRVLRQGSRPADAPYWNPRFETVDASELRSIETTLLRRQLAYTANASAFYAAKWLEASVDLRRVGRLGVEALADLPLTEKSELQAALAGSEAFGSNQAGPLDRLIRMQATGGTTSPPMRMAISRRDAAVYCEAGARTHWAAGVRPGDVVFECMNYSLYAGGVNDHMTFEALGACVAPVGVGQSTRLLSLLGDMAVPGALYATPSYALHLAATARAEGLDPRALGLRKGVFSGDAGLEVPAIRAEIEAAFGMVARNVYGTSETAPLASECAEIDGLHWMGAGLYLPELIETETGTPLAFEDGIVGELVITTLDREAHPLIRLRTRDHVRVTVRPCRCGRTGFRFEVLGRADDMFIVRGINVYPLAVGAIVGDFRPMLTGEYQIVLEERPPLIEPPLLRVELTATLSADERESLRGRLADRVRELLVFTPNVVLLDPGEMPRSEMKAQRLVRAYDEHPT